MKIWTLYVAETGQLSTKSYTGPDGWLPPAHEGLVAIEGEHDHLSKRVDLDSGQIVDWQPPPPSADHEWNGSTRRWILNADAASRADRRAVALARIDVLEAKQPRAIREMTLGYDGAKQRLQAIDDEIIQLRTALK